MRVHLQMIYLCNLYTRIYVISYFFQQQKPPKYLCSKLSHNVSCLTQNKWLSGTMLSIILGPGGNITGKDPVRKKQIQCKCLYIYPLILHNICLCIYLHLMNNLLNREGQGGGVAMKIIMQYKQKTQQKHVRYSYFIKFPVQCPSQRHQEMFALCTEQHRRTK